MEQEDNLADELEAWHKELIDDIVERVDFEQVLEHGVALAKETITQVVREHEEEYKTIIGKQAIKTFNATSEKVDKQLIIKENEQIIDTLINYDNLTPQTHNNNTAKKTRTPNKNNIHYSYKKKIINTIQTVLDKFIPKPRNTDNNLQLSLDNFIQGTENITVPGDATPFIDNFIQSITSGVANSLSTPNHLFEIIPNQTVLDYLENRVFIASPQTMEKVTDKIYGIISKEAEIKGNHPYDIAKTLQKEFKLLSDTDSRRIARTEVLRSKNEANWQRLQDNPTVELVQWKIGVEDDNSREDHVAQNEMITYIGNQFPNGQRYPYDEESEPGDYINCRCGLEAYYPDIRYSPPSDMDCWFESDMVYSNNVSFDMFDVIFTDD